MERLAFGNSHSYPMDITTPEASNLQAVKFLSLSMKAAQGDTLPLLHSREELRE